MNPNDQVPEKRIIIEEYEIGADGSMRVNPAPPTPQEDATPLTDAAEVAFAKWHIESMEATSNGARIGTDDPLPPDGWEFARALESRAVKAERELANYVKDLGGARCELKLAERERDSLAARLAWRDIATAPKDGTRIFALWTYEKTRIGVETYWHSDESEGDKPFWYAPGLAWMLDGREPTHWQPITDDARRAEG